MRLDIAEIERAPLIRLAVPFPTHAAPAARGHAFLNNLTLAQPPTPDRSAVDEPAQLHPPVPPEKGHELCGMAPAGVARRCTAPASGRRTGHNNRVRSRPRELDGVFDDV